MDVALIIAAIGFVVWLVTGGPENLAEIDRLRSEENNRHWERVIALTVWEDDEEPATPTEPTTTKPDHTTPETCPTCGGTREEPKHRHIFESGPGSWATHSRVPHDAADYPIDTCADTFHTTTETSRLENDVRLLEGTDPSSGGDQACTVRGHVSPDGVAVLDSVTFADERDHLLTLFDAIDRVILYDGLVPIEDGVMEQQRIDDVKHAWQEYRDFHKAAEARRTLAETSSTHLLGGFGASMELEGEDSP